MFETRFDKEESLYKNLLKIKGLGTNNINVICNLLGINNKILYKELDKKKIERLLHILVYIKKETNIRKKKENILLKNKREEWQVKNLNSIVYKEIIEDILKKKKSIVIDDNLNDLVETNIKDLIIMNAYRGRRIKMGYPSRGQRTRTNAQTAKKLNKKRVK